MEQIKLLFKRAFITAVLILLYGVITATKEIYIGMFLGALVSILALYMIYQDVNTIVVTRDSSKKRAMFGYLKRYILYSVFFGIMGKIGGLSMILGSAIGLLNVKGNIYLLVLSDKFKKFRDNHLK